MDFFEHQEQARRRSRYLVVYFLLAVAGTIVSVYAVIAGAGLFLAEQPGEAEFWDPGLFAICSVVTAGIILLGTGYKTMQLGAGGAAVARDLGGRQLDPSTTDFHERRLINVVEEMSIASGIPVPEIYVMDEEDSINAFAAGRSPSDAVVGVTRGCMKLLTRDELQGVVAHEFSHILNGDMRLNLRLIGLLFGILFIAMIGQMILRGAAHGARHTRSREAGGGAMFLLALGLAIMLVGYAGLFFGKLIKAAVSRQREFLADASAVQFTRNPEGIAGALRKIGGFSHGSVIRNSMAEEASHLFFGNAMRGSFLATHPPLGERIRRLAPSWGGQFSPSQLPAITPGEDQRQSERRASASAALVSGLAGPATSQRSQGETRLTEAEAFASLERVHHEQVELGRELHGGFPEGWMEAAHSESGAQALLFALLLGQDQELLRAELEALHASTDPDTSREAERLHGELAGLHSAAKLGLVDLAIPSLRRLSPEEYRRFRETMARLIAADQRVDLFEFALEKVIRRHLDIHFGYRDPLKIRWRDLRALREDVAVFLTTLAGLGHPGDPAAAGLAFREGAAGIEGDLGAPLAPLPPEQCTLERVEAGLSRFAEATPLMKRQLVHACGRAVMADHVVTSDEAELIRAIADAIGCPLPPFVKTGAEAAGTAVT